jgi:hypothetical protein
LEDESGDSEDESSSGDENNAIPQGDVSLRLREQLRRCRCSVPRWYALDGSTKCAAVFEAIDVDPVDDQADGDELEKFYASTLMSLMGGRRA